MRPLRSGAELLIDRRLFRVGEGPRVKRQRYCDGRRSADKKKHRRRIWSAEKARVNRGGNRNPKFIVRGRVLVVRVRAPKDIDVGIESKRHATVEFLRKIRMHSARTDRRVVLDFSQVERIYPAGAVLLVAEVHKALSIPGSLLQARRCRAKLVDEVLQQIGVYSGLGIQCEEEPSSESVIHWRQASGVLAEGSAGGTILENYQGRLAEGLTRGIYDGMVEAMTNTIHHAYADDVPGGSELRKHIGKRWWVLSEERDGMLTVVIADLGVGIARSLPRSKTYDSKTVREFWRNAGLDRSDGSAIAVAVRLGRTRTEAKERGRGLADIVEAVNLSDQGSVLICSNRGNFSASKGKERVHTSDDSIHGTLVHWKVPIPAIASADV